jgi:phenylacetate-CoA ligase
MLQGENKSQYSDNSLKNTVPKTCLPMLQWPAIPDPRAAQALAIQFQLNQSQWWKPSQLLHWQLKQLGEVVEHAHKNTPFYQLHYKSSQIKNNLTLDELRTFPLVTRNDIQKSDTGLRSNNIPNEQGKVTELTTSGSTGKPVDICKTAVMGFIGQAFTLRDHDWHNRELSAVFSTIRHSPEECYQAPHGQKQSTWGGSCHGIYETGDSLRLDSGCSSNEQLTWLLDNAPDYLMTYSSNLAALITRSLSRKKIPSSIKQVITLGELVPTILRKELNQAWNIGLTDVYSCQEAGVLALQCPNNEQDMVQFCCLLFGLDQIITRDFLAKTHQCLSPFKRNGQYLLLWQLQYIFGQKRLC